MLGLEVVKNDDPRETWFGYNLLNTNAINTTSKNEMANVLPR